MRSPTKAQQIADLTEQLKESRAISAELVRRLQAVYKTIELMQGMSGSPDLTAKDRKALAAVVAPPRPIVRVEELGSRVKPLPTWMGDLG